MVCDSLAPTLVVIGERGAIILFDNRRMGAISQLQQAQYGADFRTPDSVPVDYGDDPQPALGAYGRWNVGNWCDDAQDRYVRTLNRLSGRRRPVCLVSLERFHFTRKSSSNLSLTASGLQPKPSRGHRTFE